MRNYGFILVVLNIVLPCDYLFPNYNTSRQTGSLVSKLHSLVTIQSNTIDSRAETLKYTWCWRYVQACRSNAF